MPGAVQFLDFDKRDYGLRALALDTWEKLIFVHPSHAPAQSLREWLGEVDANIAGGPLTSLTPSARFQAEVAVNWKVFSDAFCEAYHVGMIHRRGIAGSFISPANPHCHLAGIRLYRHHSIVSLLGGNPNHKPTPTELFVGKFGGGSYAKGINPERHPSWNFDTVNVFPNFGIYIGADFADSYNFWPIAADRTVWDVVIYQTTARNWSEAAAKNYFRVFVRDTLREDVNTTEATQQNLKAGIITRMPLSQQEVVLRHRYNVVERWLEGDR